MLSVWELRIRNKKGNNSPSPPALPSLVDATWLPFLLPGLGFVVLYSFLGHKETRFLFPVLPLWNVAAAVGASRIHRAAFPEKEKSPTRVARVALVCLVLCLVGSLVGTLAFSVVSQHNYPGGEALELLGQRVQQQVATLVTSVNENSNNPPPSTLLQARVFIDVAAAMTGVSLFGQRAIEQHTDGMVQWTFVKEGYEPENRAQINHSNNLWSQFTHVVTARENRRDDPEFRIVASTDNLVRPSFVSRRVSDSIFVFEREDWIQKQQEQQQ